MIKIKKSSFWPVCLFFICSLAGSSPLQVENILSQESMSEILSTNNFFGRNNTGPSGHPWDIYKQEYSKAFLKNRTQVIGYDQAVDRAMEFSFTLAYGMEQLTRAELGIHEALGSILPSINLTLGDGTPLGVNEVFSGLFGFLLPQNWMKLKTKNLHLDVAKDMVKKAALDDYLNIQLVFLDLHRIVTNAEIISFYLCHLQLLERAFSDQSEQISRTLKAIYGDVGLQISYAINLIGIHHNNLAQAMVVIQDEEEQYSADAIRIDLIKNFPDTLRGMDYIKSVFGEKEDYVREVLDKSIELKIVEDLRKISEYQIGITAFGNIFSDDSEGMEPRIGLNLSYSTIPHILSAVSRKNTAQIDVMRELINFLDKTRRAYGNYSNSVRSYTEAVRSVKNNRDIFYEKLSQILNQGEAGLDEKFITFLRNLIVAEVARNDQLHMGLRYLAVMKRYMLFEEKQIDQYLPTNLDIDAAIDKARQGSLYKKVRTLPDYLKNLKKSKDLKKFLAGEVSRAGWFAFGKKSVRDLVAKHIELLLEEKGRSRKFFKTLKAYVTKEKITLSQSQTTRLKKNIKYSRIQRFWKKLRNS